MVRCPSRRLRFSFRNADLHIDLGGVALRGELPNEFEIGNQTRDGHAVIGARSIELLRHGEIGIARRPHREGTVAVLALWSPFRPTRAGRNSGRAEASRHPRWVPGPGSSSRTPASSPHFPALLTSLPREGLRARVRSGPARAPVPPGRRREDDQDRPDLRNSPLTSRCVTEGSIRRHATSAS